MKMLQAFNNIPSQFRSQTLKKTCVLKAHSNVSSLWGPDRRPHSGSAEFYNGCVWEKGQLLHQCSFKDKLRLVQAFTATALNCEVCDSN